MGALTGQVALVTGCGRLKGLGRGIALALVAAGADVGVTDVQEGGRFNAHEAGEVERDAGWLGLPSLIEEIESLGGRAVATVGDVGISADVDRMVDQVLQHFGKIDILVNNAAAPHGRDWDLSWNVPEEAFDEVLRINTKGTFLMSTAVVRHLLQRDAPGRIINISSNAGRKGMPQLAAYCASKFAIIGITQSMALELADRGITVNAVCPAGMDTARKAGSATGRLSPLAPVGRIGVPQDIARAVLFLADPAADYVTGESLNVNGGKTII